MVALKGLFVPYVQSAEIRDVLWIRGYHQPSYKGPRQLGELDVDRKGDR